MRTIAIRTPSGYRSVTLERDMRNVEEFETAYAMPAKVADLLRYGDIIEINGAFTEASFNAAEAREHADLEGMITDLAGDIRNLSLYDAVGCVPGEIAGWNLLATDDAVLTIERNGNGPWIHLVVGERMPVAIAA